MLLAEKAPHLEKEWSVKNNYPFSLVTTGVPQRYLWLCQFQHEWLSRPADRIRGRGCPYCSGRLATDSNSLKTKASHLEKYWSSKNLVKFNAVCFGSNKKCWWTCEHGHEYQEFVSVRVKRQKCRECRKLSFRAPYLRAEWSAKNTVRFEDVNAGSDHVFWWVCTLGHEWKSNVLNRTHGQGCPKCSGKVLSELNSLKTKAPGLEKQWSSKNVLKFEEVSYGEGEKYWWVCDKGHEWEAAVCDRTRGHGKATGCPSCSASFNGLEQKASELLGIPKFNKGCGPRNPKGNLYLPDFKLSDTVYVNADGLYWHGEEQKGRNYHRDIRIAFEKANLRLLQFWEDEIRDKPEIVKSMVDAVTGNVNQKLQARKLEVVDVNQKQLNDFLDKNHVIGRVSFSSAIGLIDKDLGLVQVLAYKQENGINITRIATLLNTVVRGGVGKLVAAVTRKHNPSLIYTFCDLRYADGHSLERLGFVKKNTSVQYQYTNGVERKDKRLFRVKKGVDEVEAAAARGYWRIWDAGRVRYELTKM